MIYWYVETINRGYFELKEAVEEIQRTKEIDNIIHVGKDLWIITYHDHT